MANAVHTAFNTQRNQERNGTIGRAAGANSAKRNSCLPACLLLLLFRFLCWCAAIVDGGFWLESCNRTSVLLWTVTSLNRRSGRRLIYSASPLNKFIIRGYIFNFDFGFFHKFNRSNDRLSMAMKFVRLARHFISFSLVRVVFALKTY